MTTFLKVFYIFLFFFLAFGVVFHLLTRSYLNPYQLIMIFGKKGCGKTTYLTKLAFRYRKKGWNVYSTEPIPGTYLIRSEDVGYVLIPPRSVLLIDEVGLIWHSRDFKKFDPKVRRWFKLQRHYKVRVYMFSQSFDVDKSLRDLCDGLFLLVKRFRVFSWAKRINKHFVLVKAASTESGVQAGAISEDLSFDSFFLWPFGSRQLTFIPKYSKHFDSFVTDDLLPVDLPYIDSDATKK